MSSKFIVGDKVRAKNRQKVKEGLREGVITSIGYIDWGSHITYYLRFGNAQYGAGESHYELDSSLSFAEVLEAASQGKKIRKKTWEGNSYAQMRDNKLCYFPGGRGVSGISMNIITDHIKAEWEIIPEPEYKWVECKTFEEALAHMREGGKCRMGNMWFKMYNNSLECTDMAYSHWYKTKRDIASCLTSYWEKEERAE